MTRFKSIGDELFDVGILCLICAAIFVVTFIGVMLGNVFAGIVWRAGAHDSAASWLAHICALSATIGVVLSVGARVTNGEWFWK